MCGERFFMIGGTGGRSVVWSGWPAAPGGRKALRGRSINRRWRCRAGQLVHHSDRGVQYASNDYTDLLEKNGIAISMSRAGNPYDNARAERFMRTLKQEEVYASQYLDLEDARKRIGEFLDQVYNTERLHSALSYRSPAEFEQDLLAKRTEQTNQASEAGNG